MQSHLSERVQGTPSEVEHRVSAFLLVNGYTRSGGAAVHFARGSRGQPERGITPQSDYTEVTVQVAAAKDEAHLDVGWRLEEVKLSKREFAKVARLRAREEYLPIERDALLAAARGEPHADRAELALQSRHATLGRVYVDRWVLIGIAALFATLWAAAKAPAAIDAIQLGGVAIGRAVIIVAGTAVSRWLARQSRAGKSTPQRKRIAEQLAVLKRRREHVTTPTDRPDAPPTPEPPPPPDRRS